LSPIRQKNIENVKISGGIREDGIAVGNTYDKYGSSNPIVRALMNGFVQSLSHFVEKSNPSTIHEVGCGEGYWTLGWNRMGINARGSDFSGKVIDIARNNARQEELSPDLFQIRSIYDLQPGIDSADLVVCCEVLEHLENPEAALEVLRKVVTRHLILSVPREPIWSMMNMARGKYLGQLGNTPGHIQRWSRRSFSNLVERHFEIIELRSPLPWTMLFCSPGTDT